MFLMSVRFRLGMPYKNCCKQFANKLVVANKQLLQTIFMPPQPSCPWSRSFWLNRHTQTNFCLTVSCLACQSHLFVARLGRTQLGRGPLSTSILSRINPFGLRLFSIKLQLRLKFWLMINFRTNACYWFFRRKRD